MADQQTKRLLTINVGSSSLKAVLYRLGAAESVELRASVEQIGTANSRLRVVDTHGEVRHQLSDSLPDHPGALEALFAWLRAERLDKGLSAIGQRVVQGGSRYSAPTLISDTLLT